MPSANEIRQQFLDFFVQKHGHTAVPSSSVVPWDDPTLLFTNAGMNQFKDVFLGTGTRPYKRAVDTQKCIRAGGKHNDLDDVGKDTYHHTFFEMLGNWSFGDYFKKEAIAWAWELLTQVWGLDKGRLHATVFEGDKELGLEPDQESFELWKTVTDIDPAHIHWGNKKDNFWEMGETGPCGPCTEVHYDRTPDKSGGKLVNKGSADVIEIWNLVFIQFNRDEHKKLSPLPAKHVDTGMGFERITAVLQGKASNYDTDVFTPIIDSISEVVKQKYGGKLEDIKDVAFRVIADHLRMLTFAISDGAEPSNKGRGSVVRSVIRRAVRFGWQYLEQREPFLFKLVPALIAHMSVAFPELRSSGIRQDYITTTIHREEADFLKTLGRGMLLFEESAARTLPGGKIAGKDVFELHTTFGFPPDLTRQMAEEKAVQLDEEGYRELMELHKGKSRYTEKAYLAQVAFKTSRPLPSTDDSTKWSSDHCEAKVVGWIRNNEFLDEGSISDTTETTGDSMIFDKTCFYAEAGGQVGDKGVIKSQSGEFTVTNTYRQGDCIIHFGWLEGQFRVGETVRMEVDEERTFTKKNHTATHLLNWALRKVLGDHIEQKGSLVDPDKTRFDFAHPHPLTPEEVAEVERLVNEKIYADLPVRPTVMPLAEAKKIPGVRAVFGEKYPDPVRVLLIGAEKPFEATAEHSVEFCGGTHLNHTGQAGFFKIVGQEAVGKGVRRVTAVTGREAVATVQRLASVVDELIARFNCKPADVSSRIDALQDEIKKLQQQLKKGAAGDLQTAADKLLAGAAQVNGAQVIVGEMPAGPDDAIRTQVDRIKQKAGSAVVVVGWADDGKVGLLAAVSDDLVKKVQAGKLVGQVATVVGGKGGGKPSMAQAGGKDAAKLTEALQLALKLATEQLGE